MRELEPVPPRTPWPIARRDCSVVEHRDLVRRGAPVIGRVDHVGSHRCRGARPRNGVLRRRTEGGCLRLVSADAGLTRTAASQASTCAVRRTPAGRPATPTRTTAVALRRAAAGNSTIQRHAEHQQRPGNPRPWCLHTPRPGYELQHPKPPAVCLCGFTRQRPVLSEIQIIAAMCGRHPGPGNATRANVRRIEDN